MRNFIVVNQEKIKLLSIAMVVIAVFLYCFMGFLDSLVFPAETVEKKLVAISMSRNAEPWLDWLDSGVDVILVFRETKMMIQDSIYVVCPAETMTVKESRIYYNSYGYFHPSTTGMQ